MNVHFYPLSFNEILKDRIWGGTKLKDYLGKEIVSKETGESWEISTVPNDISVVKNGYFKDKSLDKLISLFPVEILGEEVFNEYGTQFPLLFKFIDARTDLSIQLHPNNELAKKRHNSFGKTEMWYVMQADENARIVVGFKNDSNAKEYIEYLNNKKIVELLNEIFVKKGDVFFLETGTIHAIGGGIVIAEIQQTSDITYRVYDWDRVDANGNQRELHVNLALDAINYSTTNTKVEYNNIANKSNEVVHCSYFKTNIIPLGGNKRIKKNADTFVVYMCTEGAFEINCLNEIYYYKKGDTVLMPAILTEFELIGNATLLEIYM